MQIATNVRADRESPTASPFPPGISHCGVATPVPAEARPEALLGRVRAEYFEMPGLCLTLQQACRLWQLDSDTCHRIFEVLLAECFLTRTAAGAFVAATGSTAHSIRREVIT